MTFDVDVSELRAASAALDDFDELAGDAAADLLDTSGDAAAEAVRSRASRHRVTGRMVRQIDVTKTGEGIRHEVDVRAGGPVARFVAGGTEPHVIRPIRARALHLGGNVRHRFLARVHHPGTRADPFVEQGLDDATGDIDRSAQRTADRLAEDIATDMDGR